MSASAETIALSRCEACGARFLPSAGACSRCGSDKVVSYSAPALGTVLAATELTSPAEGWHAPHRLALVELPESVRLLAILDGGLPTPGTIVGVRKDGEVYRARTEPSA